jgi:hypothetical protein
MCILLCNCGRFLYWKSTGSPLAPKKLGFLAGGLEVAVVLLLLDDGWWASAIGCVGSPQ